MSGERGKCAFPSCPVTDTSIPHQHADKCVNGLHPKPVPECHPYVPMTTPTAPLADWQRFTQDPEDTQARERCGARSKGHGRPHDPEHCATCAESMGICLRRLGHTPGWHEGRSREGSLVSWPT